MSGASLLVARRLTATDWCLAAAMVALAALLRFPRLAQTPGWDADEGYNLEIAWQLLHGRAQYFALDYAYVQHPPLFYVLLAPLLSLFGRDVLVARALSAASGALAAGSLYLGMALSGSRRAAVLGTLAYATTAFVVAYQRFGYGYTLLLLWTALTVTLVLAARLAGKGWLWWAATGVAALGPLTEQEGVALPVFVALVAFSRYGRNAWRVALAGLGPWLGVTVLSLVVWPDAAVRDWQHSLWRTTAGSVSGGVVALATAGARWTMNYFHLLRAEWWWPAAIAGLFCIRPLVARRLLMLLTALLALPIFALREVEPVFRTAIPLFVPAAWGLGALLDAGVEAASATAGSVRFVMHGGRIAGVTIAAAVLLPLGLEVGRTAGGIATRVETRFDWVLVLEAEQDQARIAAQHVNDSSAPRDVVITSPPVSWLYKARVVDFFQAVAYSGTPIAFYPGGLPASRFRFAPTLDAARFAVLDASWDRWSAVSPAVRDLAAAAERWPLVRQAGQFRVHRNPALVPAQLTFDPLPAPTAA